MVSVIIPTYNYAAYLPDTLDSLLQQSYTDWECIVVDDGSQDQTAELVDAYCQKDKRFRYFFQVNQGVSQARNLGINEAKGDFIQFLDGDDLLQKDKIQTQHDYFQQEANVDIVYGEVRYFSDGNSRALRYSLNDQKEFDWLPKHQTGGSDLIATFTSYNFLVMNAPLIKKEVFERVGYFNPEMKAIEDWDFWLRCALSSCIFHFVSKPESFALVRVHEGSLSTQQHDMNQGRFAFYRSQLRNRKMRVSLRIKLTLKYVELLWDLCFKKGTLQTSPVGLFGLSILLLPVYFLIKIRRLVS